MDKMMSSRRARVWGGALAAAVVMLLGACTGGPQTIGEPVGSWQQTGGDHGWVDAAMPIETVALTTNADVEQWLAAHVGDVVDDGTFDDLLAVDLSEAFVVVGGYGRCTEYSSIVLEADGSITFEVTAEDERTDCAWMPYVIDAWAVPLEATGGVVPEIGTGDAS